MRKIEELFKNKKVLILGYGKEGKSTHNFLKRNNIKCELYISDLRDIKDELIDNNVNIVDKELYLKHLNEYDIIMKTPGISLKEIDTNEFNDKIYSQSSIFIELYKNQIIGVTGTKGKSTTSSLIAEFFKKINSEVFLLGNVGIPFFDEIEKISDNSIIVCEFSCHQLEYVKNSPKISIITNIYEEHLDYYKDFLHYIYAKYNIMKYQTYNDISIINNDNINIIKIVEDNVNQLKGKIIKLSSKEKTMFHMKHNKIYYNNEVIFDECNKRYIMGEHNLYNIMVLFVIADIFNISNEMVYKTVEEFRGLPHRLEYVCEYNGVKYYNDSISTIPESCIAALDALKNVDTIIIGGMDRGINYEELIKKINSIENLKVICINEVGKKVFSLIKNEKYLINDMSEIVKKSIEITNNICLLSPAASSYGTYKNFEERGNRFKDELRRQINENI